MVDGLLGVRQMLLRNSQRLISNRLLVVEYEISEANRTAAGPAVVWPH